MSPILSRLQADTVCWVHMLLEDSRPFGVVLAEGCEPHSIPQYALTPTGKLFACQTLKGRIDPATLLLSLQPQGFRWCFREESDTHPSAPKLQDLS